MAEDYSINGPLSEFTAETPLIAKRGVTKKGTPKNLGYILSGVYFVLRTYVFPMRNMIFYSFPPN